MMKVILKMDYADEKTKQKAMKRVSGLPGVESIALDPKDKKLTVTGMVDPIVLVGKLRKICDTWIVSAGSAEKKKEEPKKEVPKKPDDKKKDEAAAQLHRPYQPYHHPYNYYCIAQPQPQPAAAMGPPSYTTYYHRTSDEDPNACVIS